MTTAEYEVGTTPEGQTGGMALPEESANMRFVPYVDGQPGIAESGVPAGNKSILVPVAGAVVLGIAGASLVAMFMMKPAAKQAPPFQDLGAGISNSTGLKGSLQIRWQDKGQYQIKIEPIHPLESDGFSYLMADQHSQFSINFRVLDATGFALCTKEILIHSDSANESGKDVFQNAAGEDGKVNAISAQGALPCTADQFKQASYWDFTTSFPTLAEQDALLKKNAAQRARQAAQQRQSSRPTSAFFMEGDDRANGYDASRNVLEAQLGRNFLLTQARDRSVAHAWAVSESLFHYKCDQHSHCTLTHAGGGQSIYVLAM